MKVTIDNLKEATSQQVFDTVAKHLLKQNEKALDDNGDTCVNLSREGLQCAVGCLIPVETLHSWPASYLTKPLGFMVANDLIKAGTHYDLLMSLQKVHDQTTVDGWASKLEGVAQRYDLNDEVLNASNY